MPKDKSKAQLQAENEVLKNAHISTSITSVANNLIRWGGLAFMSYMFVQAVIALAGKETTANILIKILGNVTITYGILGTWATGATFLYLKERASRKKTIKKIHPRIKELEQLIDPKRSSSTLTETGETNPSDNKWESV